MTEIRATNITWHEGHVTREERQALLKQKGVTLWFTGLSGSGKSTAAFTLEHALVQMGRLAYVLDGDNVRHGLNKNLGFSAADREENIRRIGELKGFTGIDDPYEEPLKPELTLDATSTTPQQMAQTLIDYLRRGGYIQS